MPKIVNASPAYLVIIWRVVVALHLVELVFQTTMILMSVSRFYFISTSLSPAPSVPFFLSFIPLLLSCCLCEVPCAWQEPEGNVRTPGADETALAGSLF